MITVRTLLAYLFGSATAARRVASHPHALWIGFLFVVAAGFAREYDAEDLLHEPWHLAIPLVASLVTSGLLYMLLRAAAGAGTPMEERGGPFTGYPAFLRLYWWTAPLAFVYAIPVERLLDPVDATRANLYLLGLVATWRVVLITRATSATWRAPALWTLMPVMLFADSVAIVALLAAPLPVISMMGGVHLSESEALIRSVADNVLGLGTMTWVIWMVGTVSARRVLRQTRLLSGEPVATSEGPDRRVSWPLLGVTLAGLLVWIPILPHTQPPQQRRRVLEAALVEGRFDDAIELVRGRTLAAYPIGWDLPPRIGYGEREPHVMAVLAAAVELDAPLWFALAYARKVMSYPPIREPVHTQGDFRSREVREHFERFLRALPSYRHARELAADDPETTWNVVEAIYEKEDVPESLQAVLPPHWLGSSEDGSAR